MKKNLFEIYLTSEYVQKEEWMKLIYKISKINGMLKPWKLWIHIENNYIRYFIQMKRILPPILGELGSFLFKKTDININGKAKKGIPYILTSNNKTVVEAYDNNETKRIQKLKNIEITFYPYKYNNFLSTTIFYLTKGDNKTIKRRVLFNSCISEFLSVDFGIHTRFFYQKEEARYLETKKAINLLTSNKDKAILKANVFPYLQEELYLNNDNYDFNKHSIMIGASRNRQI